MADRPDDLPPIMARPVKLADGACGPLAVLLENMPSRRLAAAEVGLVILAFMGPAGLNHLPESVGPAWGPPLLWGLTALVLAGAYWLLRAGNNGQSRRPSRLTLAALVVALLWPLAFEQYLEISTLLIARQTARQAAATMPADSSPVAEPLKPGPQIPEAAVRAGEEAAEAYIRNTQLDLAVVRGLSIVILVLLLMNARGQSPAQLGLFRRGWVKDLACSLPALGVIYALLISTTVLLFIAMYFLNQMPALETEGQGRLYVFANVLPHLSFGKILGMMILVGAYEEIVFRGFLVPRLKVLTGSWTLALLAAVAIFGIGHLYLGTIAVFQASLIGLTLGLIFLWRGRLLTAIAAHALFNTIQYSAAEWLLSGGLQNLRHALEKMLPPTGS